MSKTKEKIAKKYPIKPREPRVIYALEIDGKIVSTYVDLSSAEKAWNHKTGAILIPFLEMLP